MNLTCLVYADSRGKLNTIKKVIRKYCSPELILYEMTTEELESKVTEYRPNIIIVDVSGTFAQTIQIVERFRQANPEAFFAVFVEYREFSFSNDSMTLENVEFLPRPICADTLQECVTRLVNLIHQRRDRVLEVHSLQLIVNDNIPVIRQHYLSMLMRTSVPDANDIRRKFATLRIDCRGPYYTVVIVDMSAERTKPNYEAISFLALSTLKSMLKAEEYQVYIFFDSEYRINCLVGHGQRSPELSLNRILLQFSSYVMTYMGIFPYVGAGGTAANVTEIHISYRQAETALKYAQSHKSDIVVLYETIKDDITAEIVIERLSGEIANSFNIDAIEETLALIRDAFCELGRLPDANRNRRAFAIECAYHLISKAERNGVDISALPEVHRCALMLFDAVDEASLNQQLNKIVNLLGNRKENRPARETKRAILQATQYIEAHLEDADLNLETISSYVGFSRTYFCRYFHRELGESFSDYLKRKRIEKAKQLLQQTNMKINEIAFRSGFSSPKYFSAVFKEREGIQPSEYRMNSSYSYVEGKEMELV